jgi:hypothetical protein
MIDAGLASGRARRAAWVACQALWTALLDPGTALADDAGLGVDQVEIHGFVSQGVIKTTANNYLAQSERGSFEFSEAGINFTHSFTPNFRIGAQLFSRDLGPIGNYRAQFDWYHLSYRFADWLGVRAGRTKLPFGLYNDTSDIDVAHVPALLPQSVYPAQNRDYLLAQTGAELFGFISLGNAGAFDYRLYGGTIFFDPPQNAGTGIDIVNVETPYLIGGRILYRSSLPGLTVGGSVQRLRLDVDYDIAPEVYMAWQEAGRLPPEFGGDLALGLPVTLWVASAEYAGDELLVAAEYTRWHARYESEYPNLVPNRNVVSEGFYVMASYHVTSWFTPGVYYAGRYPNVDDRHGRDAFQHDAAITVRYDINEHWLFKLESHYMYGTAGLRAELNDGKTPAELTKEWGVFLAKTTAYF